MTGRLFCSNLIYMASTYGYLKGNRGTSTRASHDTISSDLQTWSGSIETTLRKDGSFTVHIGPKGSARTLIVEGNVDTREVVHIDPLTGSSIPVDRPPLSGQSAVSA